MMTTNERAAGPRPAPLAPHELHPTRIYADAARSFVWIEVEALTPGEGMLQRQAIEMEVRTGPNRPPRQRVWTWAEFQAHVADVEGFLRGQLAQQLEWNRMAAGPAQVEAGDLVSTAKGLLQVVGAERDENGPTGFFLCLTLPDAQGEGREVRVGLEEIRTLFRPLWSER